MNNGYYVGFAIPVAPLDYQTLDTFTAKVAHCCVRYRLEHGLWVIGCTCGSPCIFALGPDEFFLIFKKKNYN